MRRRLFRGGPEKLKVIGAAGTRSGCGTTHFVLCAANYLSNVRKKHVAVCSHFAEAYGFESEYRQAKVIQNKDIDGCSWVTYRNITFLAGEYRRWLSGLREQYDYLIVDFGQVDYVEENSLKLCEVLFLIGDLSLWHYEASMEAAFRLHRRYVGDIFFMSAFYSKAGLKAYRRASGKNVLIIPVDMEPFAISHDTLVFMEQLFGELSLKI